MITFVEAHPDQAFPRYGLAMEYAKRGDLAAADEQFAELRSRHPDYLAAYFHHGMLLLRLERKEEARRTWEEGIRVAAAKGDEHTKSELEAVLADLGPA
jgi:tetratricopeptide (TPR) repeat protein